MPPRLNISKKMKNVGSIRKSKITSTYGVGALVEFPGFSGIMGGLDLWSSYINENMKIHEKSLEDSLHKQYFVQPLSDDDNNGFSAKYTIPVIRFPSYYYCPDCSQLDYARKISRNLNNDKDSVVPLECNKCGCKELLPSRFVMVCQDGHIEDFPYEYWAHKKTERCSDPQLTFEYKGMTGGLESIFVNCKTCGASQSMANCLAEENYRGFKCSGNMPWFGYGKKCDCDKPVRALMRGANNIYYPEISSALTIPPWSSSIQQYINANYDAMKTFYNLDNGGQTSKLVISKYFIDNALAEALYCDCDTFIKQLALRFEDKDENEKENITLNEYRALCGNEKDDPYFKTEQAEVADSLKKYIKQVKIVHRLREVNVLRGFRRIDAYGEDGSFPAKIAQQQQVWLPASELLGEGIFIQFNNDSIEEWKNIIGNRYQKMQSRFNVKRTSITTVSEKFVLLHTFSHLLIRELAMVCGYDTSSITERVYVSDDEINMAGILLYTASASSDGSLGGLAREGYTDTLESIIDSMIERARWCSNDPICLESEEQGFYALNYAACHACTLLTESSCKYNNVLLDRCAVIGNNNILGYCN